jgi:hypothetical protein
MKLEIGRMESGFTTQYAPLAAIWAVYQAENRFQPLADVSINMKSRDFSPHDKLLQVLFSILSGCETLSEVNPRLKFEQELAQVGGWPRFADQSSLSRMLDELTQKQIDEIQFAGRDIWWQHSQIRRRDWRKYLWLDFDLSGLPCSAQAEESQKGYFGEKKHHWTAIGPCECHRRT